ncbi:hypothetical protein LZG00_16895 [Rhodobacteraceae bacterium LMO-12]|nr:hypothetical protein [Rhodobacteraceae bacterium LMO-JJ12]
MPNRPNKAKINAQIDENLRRVFEEDAASELPPQLLQLLNKLDEIEVPIANAPPDHGMGDDGADEGADK